MDDGADVLAGQPVPLSELDPTGVGTVQAGQLNQQDGRLQFVQTAVESARLADVALPPAVLTEFTEVAVNLLARGDHYSAVTNRTKVLCGVEAEATSRTVRTNLSTA